MPRWIDQQIGKAERQRRAKLAHDQWVERHKSEAVERRAFEAELKVEARNRERPVIRAARPGERRLPDLSDEELRVALGRADRAIPRHLDYPHLLMLRDRGFTRMVWADVGAAGEFGAPTYRGDVLTEVGERWLNMND